jgi:nitrite reductase (NADH) large subunit
MRIVILGAGPAGVTAAETIRATDPTAHVTLVSAEPYQPYSPPAMADYYSTGRERPLFWKGSDVAASLGVVYRSGVRAVGIDTPAHEVALEDGSTLPYDRLLLATGASLYAPLDRSDLPGIGDFKSLSSANAMLTRVRAGEVGTALVVGNGFIGMEIALLLADLGVRTTIIGRRPWLMPRMLDPETAALAAEAMEARGVELLLGVEATSFEGSEGVTGVRLADGRILSGDLCIAATGVRPNIAILAGTGVETSWGVVVDRSLRTSVPDVYAAGDLVEAPDLMTGEPYVHAIFPNAVEQGRIAGANVLGAEVRYAGAHSMNSLKHLGLPLLAVGAAEGERELVWRSAGVLRKAFLAADDRLVGYRLTGDVSGAGFLRSLIVRGVSVGSVGRRLMEPGYGVAQALPTAAIHVGAGLQ